MPDLSMLVLKRRRNWSKLSPSRGSTCTLVAPSAAGATRAVPAAATTAAATAALLEARRAIDGLVTAGLEWHLRLVATARAGGRKHLSRSAAATATAV